MRLALLFALLAASMATAEQSSCPYETAHEAALGAAEAVVLEQDGWKQLHLEFNGIAGDRVPAFLYLPKGDGSRAPAVLLQYGSGGHKDVDYIVALGRQFVAHGFVVLTIDAPGKGERHKEDVKLTDWILDDKGRAEFLQYCGDYSRAVDYLCSRDDVDPDRIGFVGLSWGAITGVTFVAHDPRVKAMGCILGGGGFFSLAEMLRGGPRDGHGSIDPAKNVGLIAPRPLLLVNAKNDQIIPRAFAKALHRAAGEGAEKVWLDSDHLFNGIDREKVGEQVIRFIQDHLPEGPL